MMGSVVSPPLSFTLPTYAKSVAHAFATALSPPVAHRRSRSNPGVCRYLNVEAVEDSDCLLLRFYVLVIFHVAVEWKDHSTILFTYFWSYLTT